MIVIIVVLCLLVVWGIIDYKKGKKEQIIRQNGGLKRLYPNFVAYYNSDFAMLHTPFGYVKPTFLHDSDGKKIGISYGSEHMIEMGIIHSSIIEYYCSVHYKFGEPIAEVKGYISNRKPDLTLVDYHLVFTDLYQQLQNKINLENVFKFKYS